MEHVQEKENGVMLSIKVIPNSSKNELIYKDGALRLKITTPPVDGKANKFVTEFLSKKFKIPKTSIEIIRGDSTREKLILLGTTDEDKKKNIINIIKEL